MGKLGYRFFLYIGLLLGPMGVPAQGNDLEAVESAEVSLEDYSDQFQELFFEALKQKGIENYDKAIKLFLECKRLDGNNATIDHELAKAYLVSNQLPSAQEHAQATLRSMPENYWVLNLLVTIMERQGADLDLTDSQIPHKNIKLRENLALIYYARQNYENALKVLDGMEGSDFSKELTFRIGDSVKERDSNTIKTKEESIGGLPKANPIADYISLISDLLDNGDFKSLEVHSLEALERFPSHPYFYYAYGTALNRKGQNKEAITILESGVDFLLDDMGLSNKIYKELADANRALGNTSKANMYLSKIKPGL